MIGLFFEVEPLPGHSTRYFDLAVHLKPELDKNAGLVFIDRFSSNDRPGIVLSHSWWANEEALIEWRQHAGHRAIQRAGRERHFKDYRIRIGRLAEGIDAVSSQHHVYATYLDAAPNAPVEGELFKSVYRDNKWLILSDAPLELLGTDQCLFDVIRDYTMFNRNEAPQHYPPVYRV